MGLLRTYIKEISVITFIVVLFLTASYLSQLYVTELTELFGRYGTLGMAIYVAVATLATIIAPVSFLPLLPVAVALWGSLATALLSILAWTIGAGVAFLLARRFGKPLVTYFVGEKNMIIFSKLVPQNYMFLAVVFLRMFLPVDLLSYALGLFGVIQFWPYLFATIIGVAPFAFVFSYIVHIPILYQGILFGIGILSFFISLPYIKKRYEKVFLETVSNI